MYHLLAEVSVYYQTPTDVRSLLHTSVGAPRACCIRYEAGRKHQHCGRRMYRSSQRMYPRGHARTHTRRQRAEERGTPLCAKRRVGKAPTLRRDGIGVLILLCKPPRDGVSACHRQAYKCQYTTHTPSVYSAGTGCFCCQFRFQISPWCTNFSPSKVTVM